MSYLDNTVARYPSQGSHNELLCISFTYSDDNIHPTSSQIVFNNLWENLIYLWRKGIFMVKDDLTTYLAERPRMIGVLFAMMLLLTQAGNTAASTYAVGPIGP